jgi:hypothetical protein
MKLTETRLRSIIREELSRLDEELMGQNREFVAGAVEKAVDMLGLPLRRNTAGGRSSGELEFVNDSDDMGFFVRGEVQELGRGFKLEIVGRGRGRREGGTTTTIGNQADQRDVQRIADAIEDEPLGARMRR